MSIKWKQPIAVKGVKSIVWISEQVAEDYRRARRTDRRIAYLGEGIRAKLDPNPESLPDGSYILLGLDGGDAVYYHFGLQRGAIVPAESIKKMIGFYSYKRDGIPNYLNKKEDKTPAEAEPRTSWAVRR